jgi:hypothetical protein
VGIQCHGSASFSFGFGGLWIVVEVEVGSTFHSVWILSGWVRLHSSGRNDSQFRVGYGSVVVRDAFV